ncbi:MAG: helix-turn-helix transcriptional regulator [Clostridia bacterium]|nr:helix-turn-helix transcriptional regulator [Clostridia bacterium]
MKQKILNNLKKGKYLKKISDIGYLSIDGWTDYLISEKIIFSHRTNDYYSVELPENLHAHDYFELTLIPAGQSVEYVSDGQSIGLKNGIAILTQPMKMHMFRLKKPILYDRFVIYFKDVVNIFPDNKIMDFIRVENDSSNVFELNEKMIALIKSAERELHNDGSPYFAARAYLDICSLFAELSDRKPIPLANNYTPHFIIKIKEYIDKNYLTIHSVTEVAQKFFYSREYVSRSFRQYYNTPIYEYILKRKMIYCCILLQQGEHIENAAHRAGFYNMPSFVKLFRKFNGCTPSEYAKASRK